ncbi:Alkaline phosphatase synthesis transcriptional regulatory protein PhoP [wastewater metagenome]|uniref:Alkaline phosphatase synthesis transcriptional regulatory protein PhoP n=2 Tax=unclassified sequences TaxID=12908 RepID=A0A5B8R8V9_9ZZZZ|nr:response regulator [Arhodomonas sp. KWT]QEA05186.1 alkaline phosphatase synthesis transcriptional regulatory protein PhoP [uncultured organism]
MTKTILIVDDSASIRQVVATTLRGANYDVIEAGDGQAALEKLTGQRVHLVISDVNMPRLDGIGFLKALRGNTAYRFTPVMMLTTESSDTRKAEGRAAGARAWLVKPFQPQQLLDAVAKLAA